MNTLSRYRSPSNPPNRYLNRIPTTDSIELPSLPKKESNPRNLARIYSSALLRSKSLPRKIRDTENEIFDSDRINEFSSGQHVTIVVIIKSIVNFKNTVIYINAITSDMRRVVIKSYDTKTDMMSMKKGCVYKFNSVRVKDVANRFHSDVNVDFIYNNYSTAHYVNSESINYQNSQAYDIADFKKLGDYVDQKIKITGTVSKSPRITGDVYVLEVSDSNGAVLKVKISPATFFIEAIQQGNNYHFIGDLTQNGSHYELQVQIPDITSIAISQPTGGYGRYERGMKHY